MIMLSPDVAFTFSQYKINLHTVIFLSLAIFFYLMSTLGSVVVIVTYLKNKKIRTFPYSIVYRMSLANLIASVGGIVIVSCIATMTAEHVGTEVIKALSIVVFISAGVYLAGSVASFLLTGLMSLNIIMNTLFPFSSGKPLEVFFLYACFATCYGYISNLLFTRPIYVTSVLYPLCLLAGMLLTNTETSLLLVILSVALLVPGTLVFFLTICSVVMTIVKFKNFKRLGVKKAIVSQLSWYLLVYLIGWSGLGALLIELLVRKSVNTVVLIWASLSLSSVGFLNAVVWLNTPVMRKALKMWCFDNQANVLLEEESGLLTNDRMRQLLEQLKGDIMFSSRSDMSSGGLLNELPLEFPPSSDETPTIGLFTLHESDLHNSSMLVHEFYDDDDESEVNNVVFSSFAINCFAPRAFHNLRVSLGMDMDLHFESLNPKLFLKQALSSPTFSQGRSGAFFVHSPDERIVLKTIPNKEFLAIQEIFPYYYKHVMKYPNSLFVRFIGVYDINVLSSHVYLLVMENIFYGLGTPSSAFDLKGSWVDRKRSTTPNQSEEQSILSSDNHNNITHSRNSNLSQSSSLSSSLSKSTSSYRSGTKLPKIYEQSFVVLKDGDMTSPFVIEESQHHDLISQIHHDTMLLRSLGLMDYSLLVGVRKTRRHGFDKTIYTPYKYQNSYLPPHLDDGKILPSRPPRVMYIFSIIDILTSYDVKKRLERCFKVVALCKNRKGVSVINPRDYYDRFNNAMENYITTERNEENYITTERNEDDSDMSSKIIVVE